MMIKLLIGSDLIAFTAMKSATYAGTFSGPFNCNHTTTDKDALAILPMTSDARIFTIGIRSIELARSRNLTIDVDGVFVVQQAISSK